MKWDGVINGTTSLDFTHVSIEDKKETSVGETGIIEEKQPVQEDTVSSDTVTVSTEHTTEATTVSEEKRLTQEDSTTTQPEITATAYSPDSTVSDSLTPSDTLPQQIAAVTDTTEETDSADTEKESEYTVPTIPEKLIDYPYKLKLSVDLVSVGMAYSTFYGYAGQGVIVLSDLLGNHQIALAGNIQGSFEENNIFAFYITHYVHNLGFLVIYSALVNDSKVCF